MTAVIRELELDGGSMFRFWCRGCEEPHAFFVDVPGRPSWSFNGDLEKPTFRPSLLIGAGDSTERCHLFLVDGEIRYLRDCHHGLAGQVVPCRPVARGPVPGDR